MGLCQVLKITDTKSSPLGELEFVTFVFLERATKMKKHLQWIQVSISTTS